MIDTDTIEFIDNKAAANGAQYIAVTLDVARAIESWRDSLFSFEWITSEGKIKALSDLSASEQVKRTAAEEQIKNREALEKPILGIGIKDNVEIGSGRAIFLTLADHGLQKIPVHIPKSCESDFKAFLADVD